MRDRARVLLACSAALVLAASFALTPEALPDLPLCPVMYWFHVPCPGCGMTRAFIALAHGRFAAAWAYNPFSYLFFGLAVIMLPQPWLSIPVDGRVAARAAVVLVAIMWIWDLARIMGAG